MLDLYWKYAGVCEVQLSFRTAAMHFQTVYKLFVGKPVTYKANTEALSFFEYFISKFFQALSQPGVQYLYSVLVLV